VRSCLGAQHLVEYVGGVIPHGDLTIKSEQGSICSAVADERHKSFQVAEGNVGEIPTAEPDKHQLYSVSGPTFLRNNPERCC
jgi:hypothetical protein